MTRLATSICNRWGFVICLTTLFVAELHSSRASQPLPEYLKEYADAATGMTTVRITKTGKLENGIKCIETGCSHRYSSAQAWNADQSLLLIANGCSGFCFFDGKTYQPLFHRPSQGECEWLPADPDHMVCVGENTIRIWSPRTEKTDYLFQSVDLSDLRLGPGKGNPSRDGGRIVVRGLLNGTELIAFVYDLVTRTKYPYIKLAQLPGRNGYCTIAPLGEKVLCFQKLDDGTQPTFVFSKEGSLLQSWNDNHRPGHGDVMVDKKGQEYLVGISKSDPDKYGIIKRCLEDGEATVLAPRGLASHVSMRATNMQDWAFASYEGDPGDIILHPDWAPYSRQIVAIAVDGSRKTVPLAETNNMKVDYDSETHATSSPDGSQVIWSSNWGVPGGPVYEFVTKIKWPQN